MKIFLKTIGYTLISLFFFIICDGFFPEEEYGGASPSDNYHENVLIGIILSVLLQSSLFIYLFYKEFSLRTIWSVLLCFCLHFLLVFLGFYLSVILIYDFIIENYPDLSTAISERDAYNDQYPNTFYCVFSMGGFMIFAIWGSVGGLKRLINNFNKN